MHDLDMDAAHFGDLDRFLDRLQHLVRLVADVGEVRAVVTLDDMAERDHFLGRGVGAGRSEQAG